MTNTEYSVWVAGIVLMLGACGSPAQDTEEQYAPQIDPAHFTVEVDNQWFPLTPGTASLYEEVGDGERVEVFVTTQTRVVMGVKCVVVHSVEYEDDEIVEETFDWYAQDADGNVWYFGEDTKEYERGELSSTAGSWEAGVDGALPGIIMKGNPQVGDSYRQEYYAGHAEDMGEVLRLGDTVSVQHGTFDRVLVTREWTPLEPDDEELAYFAPGIGLILEVEEDDRLELVSVTARNAGTG